MESTTGLDLGQSLKNGFELPILSENEEQRTLSFRFGVNIIIYSLTGNYKSDQVHVPEILKKE